MVFCRYMDANNEESFASKKSLGIGEKLIFTWEEVSMLQATYYILDTADVLFDLGLVPTEIYAKKLINQGMILGDSALVNRKIETANIFLQNTHEIIEYKIKCRRINCK